MSTYYDVFLCPDCNEETTPTRLDDAKTQWYKCENGHETAIPRKKRLNALSPSEMQKWTQDGENNFNSNKYAAMLMRSFFFRTDKKTDLIYVYEPQTGVWYPEGEIFLHVSLVENLSEQVKPHYLPDVVFYVKGATYQDVKETPSLIALENGVLNVETQKLEAPNAGYFILSKLPISYDSKADCPNIKKFLLDVFGENQLTTLQEAIGYTLLKSMPFHKAFMLLGDGSNGKSTFLTLLQTFLGQENFSNVTLQELCYNRFASANLYGKMANISADLPKTAITTAGRFKMLTGNDMISAEFKHKNAFQFANIAKMWFSCNEFPQTTEDTLAYVRRWKIFNCINVFLGPNCDPKITEKLTTQQELSGFLNFALEGLKHLLENGRFSINESEEDLRGNILKLSNPTKAFLESQTEKGTTTKEYIPEAELFAKFIIYCDKENLPTVRKAQFTLALQEYIPNVKQTKERILGKPTAVYQFIKYKTVPPVPPVPSPLLDAAKNQDSIKSNSIEGTEGTEPEKSELREKDNRKVLVVNPCLSGVRCEGAEDKTGEQCGYAAEQVLYQKDSEPCYFCKVHMDKTLKQYGPNDFEIRYGNNAGDTST